MLLCAFDCINAADEMNTGTRNHHMLMRTSGGNAGSLASTANILQLVELPLDLANDVPRKWPEMEIQGRQQDYNSSPLRICRCALNDCPPKDVLCSW